MDNTETRRLADAVAEAMYDKNAKNVVMIETTDVSSIADFFVICSADSETQVKAIADHLDSDLKEQGARPLRKEGLRALKWVLVDYGDVVAHVFKRDAREFYNLEKLWADAPIHEIEDPALVRSRERTGESDA
ncbi:MAG: ribosome silencing factor [Ignavibacteriales bacterium]|nr:ribosome silencing factor [Ignavibacteriales bacterium]